MEFNPEESTFLRMLAGNSVTASTLWPFLGMKDTNNLRRSHPLICNALSLVPMHWVDPVVITGSGGMRRLTAAYPHASFQVKLMIPNHADAITAVGELPVGVRRVHLCDKGMTNAVVDHLPSRLSELRVDHDTLTSVSFTRFTSLKVLFCDYTKIDDAAIAKLPSSLQALSLIQILPVFQFSHVQFASFAHFHELKDLNCEGTAVVDDAINTVPVGIQKLNVGFCPNLTKSLSFAKWTSLKELECGVTKIDNDTVSTLPRSIQTLNIYYCVGVTNNVSFAHLPHLKELNCRHTKVSDTAIATLPRSIQKLDVSGCQLTGLSSLAHLHVLTELICNGTNIGDDMISSLSGTIQRLNVEGCRYLTKHVSFAHLTRLKELNCRYTKISPRDDFSQSLCAHPRIF